MQHNLRDPSRDRTHGRVYRVTYEGRPLLKPAKIAGEPIEKLLDLLKEPEDRVRYRAQIELSGRDRRARSSPPSDKWLAGARHEATPTTSTTCSKPCGSHQHHNVVDTSLLKRVLASPDFRARAAATRVLVLLARPRPRTRSTCSSKLAADAHPRVRLEAVRAASFFTVPEAVEDSADRRRAADATSTSTYVRGETMKTLDRYCEEGDRRRPADRVHDRRRAALSSSQNVSHRATRSR